MKNENNKNTKETADRIKQIRKTLNIKGKDFNEDVKNFGMKSQIPCHIGRDDPMYEKYVEMLNLMRNPLIEQVMIGKLLELKILAKEEIAIFKQKE